MDTRFLSFTILLLLAGVFHIATTSIGIQCSNEAPGYKEKHPSNGGFLISQLVSGILVTILAIVGMYLAFTDKVPKMPAMGMKSA
jgi:uncharacterized membrane protein